MLGVECTCHVYRVRAVEPVHKKDIFRDKIGIIFISNMHRTSNSYRSFTFQLETSYIRTILCGFNRVYLSNLIFALMTVLDNSLCNIAVFKDIVFLVNWLFPWKIP